MQNHKLFIRISIALMLLLGVVSSAFSAGPVPCSATSPGAPVQMFERPHTQSDVVNILLVDDAYKIIDTQKLPSELEPEGASVLWLLLSPHDGTPEGWVMSHNVVVFGDNCHKFGL